MSSATASLTQNPWDVVLYLRKFTNAFNIAFERCTFGALWIQVANSFTFLGFGEILLVLGENFEPVYFDIKTLINALINGLYYQTGLYLGDLFSLLYGYNL